MVTILQKFKKSKNNMKKMVRWFSKKTFYCQKLPDKLTFGSPAIAAKNEKKLMSVFIFFYFNL